MVFSVDSIYYGDVLETMLEKYGSFYAVIHFARGKRFSTPTYCDEAVITEESSEIIFTAKGGSTYKHRAIYLDPDDRTAVYGGVSDKDRKSDFAYQVSKIWYANTSAHTGYGLFRFY